MSQDDSSSDSSSDNSDELNSSVNIAFEVMKRRLSNCVSQPKPQGVFLKKICETFTSDSVSPAKPKNKKNKTRKKVAQDKPVQNVVPEFFIDRKSESTSSEAIKDKTEENVETFDLSNIKLTGENDDHTIGSECNEQKKKKRRKKKRKERPTGDGLSSELHVITKTSAKDLYINVDPEDNPRGHQSSKQKHKEPEIMKKSVITDDYEKQDSVATVNTSHRQKKKERKLEREKTKGNKWYHMPAVELTEEQKTDLKVLQMRKALNPKRFYKANDSVAQPKFVQFGKVIGNAADFYDSRVPKKQQKVTIVEELLADTEFRQYNKRKYEEIQEARRMGKGPYKHMKRLKKHKA